MIHVAIIYTVQGDNERVEHLEFNNTAGFVSWFEALTFGHTVEIRYFSVHWPEQTFGGRT